ncbi:MAG: M48 family metallopeptidase [Kiloniellales bacterium]|nr:M48 family metallopeptidase [Kiloniellales bacterium]
MTEYRGSFNDGKRAASHPVVVRLRMRELWIEDAGGKLLATWPYEKLRAVDELTTAKTARLTCAESPRARLVVEGEGFLEELAEEAPQFNRRRRAVRRLARRGLWAVTGLAAVVAVFWVVLPRGVPYLAETIPVSWEEALGRAVLDDLLAFFAAMADEEEARTCEVAAGRAALDRLVARLGSAVDSPYDYKVVVVDLDITNAFALPGGYIVLFDGLLDFAKAPEEVAGVLAHEMGHVIHRHGTQAMLRQMGLSVIFEFLMGGGGSIGAELGGMVLALSYSREAELQADGTGIEILQSAGLRPVGLAAFFKRLQAESGDVTGPFQILSTHPSFAARLDRLKDVEDEGAASMSPADWTALRAICGPDAADEDQADT